MNRFAVVIDVSTFENVSFDALPGAAVDGERVTAFCENPAQGAFDCVVRLSSPTLAAARDAINDCARKASDPDGLAFVYLASHALPLAGPRLAIALRDSRADSRVATMLSMDDITALFAERRTPRTIVILDACHSGIANTVVPTQAIGKLWSETTQGFDNPEGHFLFAASNAVETAKETGSGGRFTSWLLDRVDDLGHDHPHSQWISAAHVGEALGRADFKSQRPEWSGVAVSREVPFWRNRHYAVSPPAGYVATGVDAKADRAALGSAIKACVHGVALIGSGKAWAAVLSDAGDLADSSGATHASVAAYRNEASSAAAARATTGSDLDRREYVDFWASNIVALGARGVHRQHGERQAILLGRIAPRIAADLKEWEVARGWLAAGDGPASMLLAPIRYWDAVGRLALAILAGWSSKLDVTEVVSRLRDFVVGHAPLHRVTWAGQYPDIAAALGVLLVVDPEAARTTASAILDRLVNDYASDRLPAPATSTAREIGRETGSNAVRPRRPAVESGDEGAVLCLSAIGYGSADNLELQLKLNTALARTQHMNEKGDRVIRELIVYVPKTVGAQFQLMMKDCEVRSWATGPSLVGSLGAEVTTAPISPLDRDAPEFPSDLLASVAAGRVFRNRANVFAMRAVAALAPAPPETIEV